MTKKSVWRDCPAKEVFFQQKKSALTPPRWLTPFQCPSNRYDKNGPFVSPLLSIYWRKFSRKKTPFTNRDRNKALWDIFAKGSAFSAKLPVHFLLPGHLATVQKPFQYIWQKQAICQINSEAFVKEISPKKDSPHYAWQKWANRGTVWQR